MKLKLNGSENTNPAIRAAALADQFNEAVWRGAESVPLGAVMVDVAPVRPASARRAVYLCGGINGLSDADAKGWREQATRELGDLLTVLDPMTRDCRGRESENVNAIVEGDLADIQACDILLVNASHPGWGTAMEVYAAHSWGRYVVAFGAGECPSPWLVRHCHYLAPDLAAALAHLLEVMP